VTEVEWCERRLLSRIHRYTLDRLRRDIEPVSQAAFTRFLFQWQRVAPETRAAGPDGLTAVLDLLDGCELPAAAWETEVLPARLVDYDPLWLDGLCLSGQIAWARLSPGPVSGDARRAGPVRSTPIALFRRAHAAAWHGLRPGPAPDARRLSTAAAAVHQALAARGASFFAELVPATRLLRTEVERALAELVAWGLISSDSFAGLRALLIPSQRRRLIDGARRRGGQVAPFGVESAGRWALIGGERSPDHDDATELLARQLLRRYGVVFRAALAREALTVPWRDLVRVYRRLEARGEIRGGRFVSGFSGEQYALPEAIGLLRGVRREGERGELIAISAADPLNLVGLLTPGALVPATTANRILYRDGVPVAVASGPGARASIAVLVSATPEEEREFRAALVQRRVSPMVRRYLAKSRRGA
jgi:ATP-dependent Lhr-like helicase